MLIQAAGLFYLMKNSKNNKLNVQNFFISCLIFALGGFVRSNGFLSIGFVTFFYLMKIDWKKSELIKLAFGSIIGFAMAMVPFFTNQSKIYRDLCNEEGTNYPFCSKAVPISYSFL